MLWLKISLLALVVIGIPTAIGFHIKHDHEVEGALGAAEEELTNIKSVVIARDGEIMILNDRIKARNEATLKELASAEAAQAKAKADAIVAKADKEKVSRELAIARKKYQEILNGDENLRVYESTVVPVAVLDRLRAANGETNNTE